MPKFAANLSFLFTELPFAERFGAAARAGFRGVEFLFPYDHDAQNLKSLALDAGVEVALFNAPPGDWDGGERGIGCLPGREAEFSDGIGKAAEYARALGCARLHVLSGIVPGGPGGEASDLYLETYAQNLKTAASHLGEFGIEVMVEPINPKDVPGYLMCTPDEVAGFIESHNLENVFMQFDLYHGAMQGLDLLAVITRHQKIIRHFQVAGAPGRHEPGSGETDFKPAFQLIDEMGFDGWVGCEYRPKSNTEAGLDWITNAGAR